MALSFTSIFLASAFLIYQVNAQQPPLPGQTVQFRTGSDGPTGGCLSASSNADGAAVVIEMCSAPTPANSWVVPNGNDAAGSLQIFGNKCLDVTDGVNADGTRLQIWTCNTNQLWEPEFGSVGNIFWVGMNKCVDLTNGDTTNGNQLQVWDCDTSNPNQIWGVSIVD
ncbi:ricin B lectin domain-containing protein [Mycena galopus ATCC 62051]|nr:ricin B lectin domain-containing protein [Mycena galopus ATCC 62051]